MREINTIEEYDKRIAFLEAVIAFYQDHTDKAHKLIKDLLQREEGK